VKALMKERLTTLINKVEVLLPDDCNQICKILNAALKDVIVFLSKTIGYKPILEQRRIVLAPLIEEYDVNVGIKFREQTIEFAEWIFNLQPRPKVNLLYFLIVKLAFHHFLPEQPNEVKDAFVNIVALLWLKEHFGINSLDNPIYASVTTRIYPERIAKYFYVQFNRLLNILFIKNISYHEVFKVLAEIVSQQNIDSEGIFKAFNGWVNSLITEIDVIAPIYLKPKLIPTLELIVKWGYSRGTTANIAKKLNYHINSVARQFRELSTRNTAFWRPIINLEKLKLNNYFLKVVLPERGEMYERIYKMLWEEQYLKSIYTGEIEEGKKVIYSPSLICPHLVSERLNEQLRKFQSKGWIDDFNLQLIRERNHYGVITTTEQKPTIETMEKLLFEKQPAFDLRKFVFASEKRDFSMEFDDRDIVLDYNLLFFLSVLKCKYLLKSRYAAYVNELPKLYKKNNIPLTDVTAQIVFLNQIEIRARRRKILSYALFMKRFIPNRADIFIFEIKAPDEQEERKIKRLVKELQVFSFLGEMVLADKHVFPLPGISSNHPIKDLIQKKIEKTGLESTYYTIRQSNKKLVPLHELYDYESQKWKL